MSELRGFASVVYPTHDLDAGVAAWSEVLGQKPAFVGADFAAFTGDGVDLGLTSRPWVNYPLVFWKVDDLKAAHGALVGRGATPLGEVADGSLVPLGTAAITNGDPETGVVDVPGGRLAVVRAPDGNLIGLTEEATDA